MTKRSAELVHLICGLEEHPLAEILRSWCASSRPVQAFLETYATKLRKKVRLAHSSDEYADLLSELAVGNFLARDRRFQLQYEPHSVPGGRNPDYQAMFKGHTQVYFEVTRLRLIADEHATVASRLARVLGDKISQCVPNELNVLAVVFPAELQRVGLVPTAVRMLLTPQSVPQPAETEHSKPAYLAAYRQRQRRLSAVLLCSVLPSGELLPGSLWENTQAQHRLPTGVVRFLTASAASTQT
ncbi:hypothetical protein [Deinococcus ruber]|uniref:Uncharacterized protein n=1 Tax=Deinococcus ruber TaxID=1848197 RepID=A0A918FH19_9DEIO|nr:hypothetical protein [Deinococcus ruber]GGR37202.1 hypothetical protein GCM10008957_53390 [Deinococcus ruber]